MDNIESLRGEIDAIDFKLVELFEKRMECAKKVAQCKRENNLPIFHSDREEEVIKSRMDALKEPRYGSYIKELFSYLMSISKQEQYAIFNDLRLDKWVKNSHESLIKMPKVAYFGTDGTYSEKAADLFFNGEIGRKENYELFSDVFKAVQGGKSDYGVLPIENSSTGAISDVLDLLNKYNCSIVGEYTLKINHCLLGTKSAQITDIKEVYSHEQGLLQCSEFLSSLDHMKLVSYFNTAKSAKYISERNDPAKACIAGKAAQKRYDLKILRENIGNTDNNHTRFIVIAKQPVFNESCDKISVTFKIPHESGSLYHILSCFANNGLNLSKIESRPVLGSNFEYLFYVDIMGNMEQESVKSALACVIEKASYFKFLGNYPSYNTNSSLKTSS